MPNLLVIDAPYYDHISKELLAGAEAVLKDAGATWDYQAVPGVLEIPAALSMAIAGMEFMEMNAVDLPGADMPTGYDGYITLGCVIRGETTHYDIVAFESARAIMQLTIDSAIALGNGIQTVENEAQALVRAKRDQLDKGGHAARAALAMIEVREKFLA